MPGRGVGKIICCEAGEVGGDGGEVGKNGGEVGEGGDDEGRDAGDEGMDAGNVVEGVVGAGGATE